MSWKSSKATPMGLEPIHPKYQYSHTFRRWVDMFIKERNHVAKRQVNLRSKALTELRV